MPNAIEFDQVTKTYRPGFFRRQPGVRDVTIAIPEGMTYGLLGPNGSGKTTIIKLILGLITPDAGAVRLFGGTPCAALMARVGYLPELLYYHDFLSPEEILRFYGNLYGLSGAALTGRIDEVLALAGLETCRRRRLKTFSKGMLQRLGIAQAVISDPDLLILDEPTMGLDPLGLRDFFRLVGRMKERGKTIVFSSHHLTYAQQVCDSVAIVDRGSVVYAGRVAAGRPLDDIFAEKVSELP